MADTIRELIIQDIVARLAVITVAGGYRTDCGLHVFRARKNLDPNMSPPEIPAVVVWPGTEETEKKYGRQHCAMTVKLDGVAYFDPDVEGDGSVVAEKILGDLIEAITSPTWSRSPDYIESIAYAGGGTETYPEAGDLTVGVPATFTVSYSFALGDPSAP